VEGDGSVESDRPPDDDGLIAGGPVGDDLVAQFARWSAGERASRAARGRIHERTLREQAASGATWAGSLVDLAEAGSRISMSIGGRRLTGTLEAVGADFCVLIRAGRRPLLARLDRVSAVWPDPPARSRAPAGSRFPSLRLSMAAAMALLAEDRAPVTLAVAGGHHISGDLVGVGEDVLTVRERDGSERSTLVALENVEYCELR